jgi:putative SOS response-associated peptidase YedK
MCARFKALAFWTRINELLGLRQDNPIFPEPLPEDVAPTLGAAVIVKWPERAGFEAAPMRFGLIPHWYKGHVKDFKATTFNARIETAAEKPVFKGAYQYRRAIVPAENFSEWSGPKTARQRWNITRADNEPLGLAGIWDETETQEGTLWSFALLTRPAGEDMAAIHEREPVILNPDQWAGWIRGAPTDTSVSAPLRLNPA